MIRYTIVVAGTLKPRGVPVLVEEHDVDIVVNMTNLDEEFLVGVNSKGQVRYLHLELDILGRADCCV